MSSAADGLCQKAMFIPPDTCDVYIGTLDDPAFRWEGGNWSGNIPARISPVFPAVNYKPFFELITRIENGTYIGKRTDWAGWAARVSKADVKKFIEEMAANFVPETSDSMRELDTFVENLNSNEEYALVACESPCGNHPVAPWRAPA